MLLYYFFIHPGLWKYFQTQGWVNSNITVFVALVSNKLFNNNSNFYMNINLKNLSLAIKNKNYY